MQIVMIPLDLVGSKECVVDLPNTNPNSHDSFASGSAKYPANSADRSDHELGLVLNFNRGVIIFIETLAKSSRVLCSETCYRQADHFSCEHSDRESDHFGSVYPGNSLSIH